MPEVLLEPSERPLSAPFWQAFMYWLKLGLISFGGPAVEATRHDVKFTAPLTAITAAVVGVVLNLEMFFAYHVLWPQGFEGPFEWFSAGLGIAAFIVLFRYKVGIVSVIAASALAGLAYSLWL